MKQIFVTMLMAIFSVAAFAQDNKNAPRFEFKDGETHNFGEIPEGPNAEYIFTFKNTGKEPLIIQGASASCGCTTPAWPKQPILPGKTGEIKVVYSTERRVGPFTKDIYILSNAVMPEGKERYELHIKGTVIAKDAAKSGS